MGDKTADRDPEEIPPYPHTLLGVVFNETRQSFGPALAVELSLLGNVTLLSHRNQSM